MRDYIKPSIEDENIELEDIIAMSAPEGEYGGSGDTITL